MNACSSLILIPLPVGRVAVECRDLVKAAISETSELIRFPSLQVSQDHVPLVAIALGVLEHGGRPFWCLREEGGPGAPPPPWLAC